MNTELLKISSNFKKARTDCKFTQQQIADFLNIDQTTIAKFEKAERPLNIGLIEKACDLFGCTLNMLREMEPYRIIPMRNKPKNLTIGDMEAIASVNKIALNLRHMNELLPDKDDYDFDSGVVLYDATTGLYFCGRNTWSDQLRNAQIYHSKHRFLETIDWLLSPAYGYQRDKHPINLKSANLKVKQIMISTIQSMDLDTYRNN